jgi:hypothetical protein
MKRNMKKKAQNLIEYLLIAALIAVACYGFVAKFNINTLKNYVFMRPADSTDSTKITIEPMTQ